jgi:hypothetical protein
MICLGTELPWGHDTEEGCGTVRAHRAGVGGVTWEEPEGRRGKWVTSGRSPPEQWGHIRWGSSGDRAGIPLSPEPWCRVTWDCHLRQFQMALGPGCVVSRAEQSLCLRGRGREPQDDQVWVPELGPWKSLEGPVALANHCGSRHSAGESS